MARESAEYSQHTTSDNVAMLELAWEMTKYYISVKPEGEVTPQGLRDEFAKNTDAVYKAWDTLGHDKGGRL